MSLVDPECVAIAAAFRRRDARARASASAAARRPARRRAGASFDLKSIRPYQPFDDPRSIDWRLLGRSDRAYVKEFYDEADDEVAFLIDASASMAGSTLDELLPFASSLSYIFLTLGIGVRLWTYADGLSPLRVCARSRGSHAALEGVLTALRPAGSSDSARAYAQWRSESRLRRVFIFSDFHDRPCARDGRGLFLLRFGTPYARLATPGTEAEVEDPETGSLLVMPWGRAEEAAWRQADATLDAGLASSPGAFYRRVLPGEARAPIYWDILERVYA